MQAGALRLERSCPPFTMLYNALCACTAGSCNVSIESPADLSQTARPPWMATHVPVCMWIVLPLGYHVQEGVEPLLGAESSTTLEWRTLWFG